MVINWTVVFSQDKIDYMAITNEYIAKIEGHGSLTIDWEEDSVKLNVHEGERLFEGILVGRTAEESHWITPRICGVCPISHNLASLGAIEDAYDIKINETSRLLRDLMMCGQMIQSHVLHMFFLVAPDYLGIDRATELAKKDPDSFAKALLLKELGDEIATIVAGRNVHPTTSTTGGFHKIPSARDMNKLKEFLEKTTDTARWTAEFFAGIEYPKISVELDLVANRNGRIFSSVSGDVSIKQYRENIEEELRDYSTAKFGKYRGQEMIVGSLARLYENKDNLKGLVGKLTKKLDYKNPFHTNIAQGIEILQFHENALEIIKFLLKNGMDGTIAKPKNKKAEFIGVGAVEAPRGGLYHEIQLDSEGIIISANIITPTVQNLTSIEKSSQALLKKYKNKTQEEKERLLNMLVRAYDPCITCSVH